MTREKKRNDYHLARRKRERGKRHEIMINFVPFAERIALDQWSNGLASDHTDQWYHESLSRVDLKGTDLKMDLPEIRILAKERNLSVQRVWGLALSEGRIYITCRVLEALRS